jgi:uncharacterized protein (DUF1697 family)
MALVVLLKGVNVGGYRRFRPSVVAKQLSRFDVVNVGAAGTFVVRGAATRAGLRAEIGRLLPFETEMMVCSGGDIVRLAAQDVFAGQPSGPHLVRFVSVLAGRRRAAPPLPLALPSDGEWSLRLVACEHPFVFGVYRREMKAIGYLGQLEKIFGVPMTTRSWTTFQQIEQILRAPANRVGRLATAARKSSKRAAEDAP